jgi:hypothetical protein
VKSCGTPPYFNETHSVMSSEESIIVNHSQSRSNTVFDSEFRMGVKRAREDSSTSGALCLPMFPPPIPPATSGDPPRRRGRVRTGNKRFVHVCVSNNVDGRVYPRYAAKDDDSALPRLPAADACFDGAVAAAVRGGDVLVELSRVVAASRVFDDHFGYVGLPRAKEIFDGISSHAASQVVSLTATATLLRSLRRAEDARLAVLAARGVAMGFFDEMSWESGVAMAVLGIYYSSTLHRPPPPDAAADDCHRADHFFAMAQSALRPALTLLGPSAGDTFSIGAIVEHTRHRLRYDPSWRGDPPLPTSEEPPDSLFYHVPILAQARKAFDGLIEARRCLAAVKEGGVHGAELQTSLKQRLPSLLAPTDVLLRKMIDGYPLPKLFVLGVRSIRGMMCLAAGEGALAREEFAVAMGCAMCPTMEAHWGFLSTILLVQQILEGGVGLGDEELAVGALGLLKRMGGVSGSARRISEGGEGEVVGRFGEAALAILR